MTVAENENGRPAGGGHPKDRLDNQTNTEFGHGKPARIPLSLLAGSMYSAAVQSAAEMAFESGHMAVALGLDANGFRVCFWGCPECLALDGVVAVVPDVAVAEMAANGHDVPSTHSIVRSDGRSALVFRGGPR